MKKLSVLGVLAMIVIAMTAAKTATAATESVYVDLLFNVASVDELTVTLLGESAVTSASGGTAMPANIEFNSSDGTDLWVNASVVAGSTQDVANAIIQLDNTGTSNLNVSMEINASVAACMGLRYNDTFYCDTPATCSTDMGAYNVTINASFEPGDNVLNIWLWGNFSGCESTDTTSRRLTLWATTV